MKDLLALPTFIKAMVFLATIPRLLLHIFACLGIRPTTSYMLYGYNGFIHSSMLKDSSPKPFICESKSQKLPFLLLA